MRILVTLVGRRMLRMRVTIELNTAHACDVAQFLICFSFMF